VFDNYELVLHVDRLVGGIPKHPTLIKRWQEAHLKGSEGEPTAEAATDATLNLLGSQAMDPDEVIEGVWTGFVTIGGKSIALENRNVKAMLKESANIVKTLKDAQVKGKEVPLRARLAERVFVRPRLIQIMRISDQSGITEPESVERPIHVMTMRGPRTALKRTDFVEDVTLTCQLEVLDDGVITEKILRVILDHASRNGLGTDRSTGAGTFTYELKKLD
jgi:hypothetical protein